MKLGVKYFGDREVHLVPAHDGGQRRRARHERVADAVAHHVDAGRALERGLPQASDHAGHEPQAEADEQDRDDEADDHDDQVHEALLVARTCSICSRRPRSWGSSG